jgi:elongation factor 1-delta
MAGVALAQQNIWFNKAQCEDAEKAYFEKLSGAKVDGLVAQSSEVDMALASKLSALELENKTLKKDTDSLKALIKSLESRVAALEGGKPGAKAAPAPADDDDEDVDLFGSDDDEEEEDAEKARVTAERLKAYAEKKSKKPALIAKTSVLLDIKPWDERPTWTPCWSPARASRWTASCGEPTNLYLLAMVSTSFN